MPIKLSCKICIYIMYILSCLHLQDCLDFSIKTFIDGTAVGLNADGADAKTADHVMYRLTNPGMHDGRLLSLSYSIDVTCDSN